MPRPRNNISRLSRETRLRICELLDNGATYDEARNNEEVAAECAEKKLTLHNSSFAAYRDGIEFTEYKNRNREWGKEIIEKDIASAVIQKNGAIANMADVVSYELIRKAMKSLEEGEEISPRDLASLARAVKSAGERSWESEKAEMAARIAGLSAKITEMAGGKKTGQGLSDEAIRKIEEAAKLL